MGVLGAYSHELVVVEVLVDPCGEIDLVVLGVWWSNGLEDEGMSSVLALFLDAI